MVGWGEIRAGPGGSQQHTAYALGLAVRLASCAALLPARLAQAGGWVWERRGWQELPSCLLNLSPSSFDLYPLTNGVGATAPPWAGAEGGNHLWAWFFTAAACARAAAMSVSACASAMARRRSSAQGWGRAGAWAGWGLNLSYKQRIGGAGRGRVG